MIDRRPWFFWFALAIATLVASAYLFLVFCGGTASTWGWNASQRGHAWFVSTVDPHGPAAGQLAPGDQVLTINGSSRAAEFGPAGDLAAVGAGHLYLIEIRRAGTIHAYSLPIAFAPQRIPGAVLYFIIGILLFAVGLWIGLIRPDQATTQVGFGAFMVGSLVFLSNAMSPVEASLGRRALFTALIIGNFWRPFHLALGYDFASRFPVSVPEGRFWRILRVAFYLTAVVFWLRLNLPLLADALSLSSRSAMLPGWFPLEAFDAHYFTFIRLFDFIVTAMICCALARNYRMLPDAGARRRMRWAAVGLAAAAGPLALAALAKLLLSAAGRGDLVNSEYFRWADSISMALSGFTAITLAYAIVKHRVLGIRVVIRRGMQYLLAKNVLRVILFSPFIVFGVQLIRHPERGIGDVLLGSSWPFYLIVIASAASSLRYRKRLSTWVDRKFFRSAYQREEILLALIERIKSDESIEGVSRIVAREIEMALHPASVYMLYRGEHGHVTLGYPASSPDAQSIIRYLTDEVQQSLEGTHTARMFSEVESALPLRAQAGAETLPELREMLLVPMTGTDQHLGGVLLLGPKKSEEPYTRRDRELLQAIAGQMAVVLEVLGLKERMRRDHKIRVEVLGRLDDRQINLLNECPACGACYDRKATHCEIDRAPLSLTLPVERTIEGKYRLDQRIGAGGMGAVFEARDLRLNRSVALKILTGQLFGNQDALRRFEREARMAAKLEHANIVPIFDYGLLGGGGAFLVMQLVRGRSWRMELKQARAIGPERAANWFDQLCDALAAAHSSGVVHRDLKPENMIVSLDEKGAERITVLDFGLAKFHTAEAAADAYQTSVGVVMGTLGYMSPEQRSGADVDARGDIFAIGVLTVETLTGHRPPATGATQAWMRTALQGNEPLAQLLDLCLAADPQSRFHSISDFQNDLVSLIRNCSPDVQAGGDDDNSETVSLIE
jgi:hypothetical protein